MASWTKKVDRLIEEFLDGIKVHNEYHEIYVNPISAEMDSVAEKIKPVGHEVSWDNAWMHSKEEGIYIRFTAIPGKKVFVFSPWILHESLDRKFGLKDEDVYIHGIAKKTGGRWICTEAHNIPYMIKKHLKDEIREFLKIDWSWLDKYFLTSPVIKQFEPQLRREVIEIDKSSRSS
jgi:hypothetical protein